MKINIKKLGKTWTIIIIIILIIIGYYFIKNIFKDPTEGFNTEKITKGIVLQEVSETGSVRATQDINLGFKSVGRVTKINVEIGDKVKKGDVLAELDSNQVSAQLQSAKAALNSANNQYDKLVNGATPENIKTYQDSVDLANNDLKSTYSNASNVLNDVYTKIYNAYNIVATINNNYFNLMDQQSFKVSESKNDFKQNMDDIKLYIDKALRSQKNSDIDETISETLIDLDNIFNDLKIIREQCEDGKYYFSVSSTDKTSLDAQRAYITTASTSLTSLQSNIKSYKKALQKAEDSLTSVLAFARPEDVGIYKSQISQAQANVKALQSQLSDNYLFSPIDGLITEVNIKSGQIISTSQPAVKILSTDPFEIKTYIYEQDIVNVKIGDSVKIELVAFPNKNFMGKVMIINPAETIVDNVVYYEVTIEFPNQPEEIRSGMTADITIETNKKNNVLRVIKNAIVKIDGKETVQVFSNNKIEDREITTGLEGNDYYEVTKGLSLGDTIITGKK